LNLCRWRDILQEQALKEEENDHEI
jgi:hypothetical protein